MNLCLLLTTLTLNSKLRMKTPKCSLNLPSHTPNDHTNTCDDSVTHTLFSSSLSHSLKPEVRWLQPLPPISLPSHPQTSFTESKSTNLSTKKMASKVLAAAVRRSLSPKIPTSIRPLSTAAAAVAEPYDETAGISMKGVKIAGRPLYLDMQATSPVDPRVLDAMLPYFVSRYGNPHSRTHLYGWESDEAVEVARSQVANLINASPKEIVFTSGATECNNISVKGVMHFYREKKKHVITTQTEHKCVLDSCRHLQQEGFEITYLPVKSDGLIDLNELRSSIRSDTGLVSVMAVNNEIGVIQPMEEIGQICKEFNIPFHTDAAQALGKIPIDVNKWNVSLMSLSGHKVYGPKGVGALYMRRRPRIRVEPQMNGGGQERGIRSGTVPTPLVVGMGAACELAMKEMEYDEKRVTKLKDRMLNGIRARLDGVVVNGSTESRYAGNLNLSFAYVEGESLLMGLKEVAVSSGSACTSASLEPSYVLRALGVDEDMAHTSIRFGIGRFTTEEEIDKAVELTVNQVEKLREMSPLYEMVKEGIDIKSIQWSQH
ncbi:hypothetical protein L6452_10505 [Arctium lappa]|uniref:Uncharacterized protein n=1 Tax=Arctium lappa TaxID=4217 RepID=A0ACB9DMS1_ARCLA|nr:hypothetical protein L6452_10505 [Arctium lappa]